MSKLTLRTISVVKSSIVYSDVTSSEASEPRYATSNQASGRAEQRGRAAPSGGACRNRAARRRQPGFGGGLAGGAADGSVSVVVKRVAVSANRPETR